MKIEKITVSGLNSALAAIGLSYGDEYDPFKVSTKKLANTLVSRGVSSGEANFLVGARVNTNYLQLMNMYKQRKNHALPEWQEFCRVVETLPRMKGFLKATGE